MIYSEKVSRQRRIVVIQEDGKARISRGMLNKKDEQQHRPLLVCASCATTDAKRWHIRGGQKYCKLTNIPPVINKSFSHSSILSIIR